MPKKQLTFVNLSMEELASAIQEEETVLTVLVGWGGLCDLLLLVEVYQG